jgi:hypothetical protein
MQLLGKSPYKKLEEVKEQCLELSRDSGFLCVYEKAKYKTTSEEPPKGRYLVCYRLWLDRDRPTEEPMIMNIKNWTPVKNKNPPKKREHITSLNMRKPRTLRFFNRF